MPCTTQVYSGFAVLPRQTKDKLAQKKIGLCLSKAPRGHKMQRCAYERECPPGVGSHPHLLSSSILSETCCR